MKKRCTFEERIQFCEEVMEDIFDSADNPLDGRLWWTQSDDPWQTLAACKELAGAIRSGDPENYVSHLPIHQDGSCNGLQHYAALGRDKPGAVSVNLTTSTVPQDVYSHVLEVVEKARRNDIRMDLPLAQQLEGIVTRKIIKQTVMTSVYGVTSYGARLQIARRLKELNLDGLPVNESAAYLAKLTFKSIGTLFSSAEEIQNWFTNIAEGLCRNLSRNVEWVTPLGFPIIQPYINLQKGRGKLASFDNSLYMPPNVIKQRNAFPPNFIHSLDSTHMMLTSLFCQRAGLTFVSIHDCYWTHASTVAVMNKVCREQFIALYSRPILEDLAESLNEKFSEHQCFSKELSRVHGQRSNCSTSLKKLLENVPGKGVFDLNEVLDSVYFFS